MKTKIFTLLFIAPTMAAFSQKEQTFIYLVGKIDMPGYEIKTQECVIEADKKSIDGAPIMIYFQQNKSLYIGGTMEDGEGNRTAIKNIKVISEGDGEDRKSTLIVEGDEFNKQICTVDGYILMNNSEQTVFYTTGGEIWKILRKKE
jgi:hypothetical protein